MDYQESLSEEKVRIILENKQQFNSTASQFYSRGWEMIQDKMGNYVGYFLLIIVGFFIIGMVLGLIAAIFPFIQIITNLGTSFISPIVISGIYIYAYNHKYKNNPDFNDFVGGFNHAAKIGGQAILVYFLSLLLFLPIILAAGIPLGLGMFDQQNISNVLLGSIGLLAFIVYLIYIFIYIMWSFAPLFIIFANMGIWESMESSRKMVFNNAGTIIVIFLIGLLLAIASIFTCGIGLLWLMPLFYLVNFLMFDDLFQLNQAIDETDDIIQHLV